jgi:hypothetical protein
MDAMAQFQEGHTHLALVSAHPAALRRTIRAGLPPEPGSDTLGILTVEDILEVMLQADITDETDAQNSAARQEASASLRMMSSSASLSASRSSAVPAHIGFLSSIFDRPAAARLRPGAPAATAVGIGASAQPANTNTFSPLHRPAQGQGQSQGSSHSSFGMQRVASGESAGGSSGRVVRVPPSPARTRTRWAQC